MKKKLVSIVFLGIALLGLWVVAGISAVAAAPATIPEFSTFNLINRLVHGANYEDDTAILLPCQSCLDPQQGSVAPIELVPQLRVSPDRTANTQPSNEIRYTYKVKNIGSQPSATSRIELPIDPNLVVGYTDFGDSGAWVSAVTTNTVFINLPPIQAADAVTGTVIFRPRPEPAITPGAKVYTRYALFYNDQQRISNAVVFYFGDSNKDDSQGNIQLAEPYIIDKRVGDQLNLQLDFFIPNEIGFAYATPVDGGPSIGLGSCKVDESGKYIRIKQITELEPGSYKIYVRGNRSEIIVKAELTLSAAK
jgi:hypothetical protein